MACRKGELSEEGKNRNAAAAPPSAVGDALLFATMCIIGMPVDVYAKDGSIYSGIFYTASVDKDYAIVLKKARMVEKGNLEGNVVNGALIETLIIRSQDLVQVVAKGVLLPSNGITGCAGGDDIEAAVGCNRCPDYDVELWHSNDSNGNKKHKRLGSSTAKAANQVGSSLEEHNERLDTVKFVKIDEAHNVSVDGRNADDGSLEIQSNNIKKPEFQDQRIINEVRGTNLISNSGKGPSIAINLEDTMQQEPKGASFVRSNTGEDQSQRRCASDAVACSVASPPNISVASTPMIDAKSESRLKASSNPFLFVPPRSSSVNRTAKESKLNPGAKIFSPSMLPHRSVSPAVPNGASVSYMPGTYPMATPQEIDANSFTHSSVPVKLVPYNNVAVGHGGNEAAYVQQPIVGQVVNRMQPARYTSQYHSFQVGPTYAHSNSQNVMLGCMGPLVCMHPVSSDVVQSAAGFSPAATRPLFAKHQGNAPAHALPLCVSPPLMANGPQQFVMQAPVPISQPLYPVLQPVAVSGPNGFLSAKYA